MGRSLLKIGIVAGSLACITGVFFSYAGKPHTGAEPVAGLASASLGTIWKAPTTDPHEAMVLEEALKKKPGHTPVLMQLADRAAKSGRIPEAQEYLRQVLQQEPTNAEARLELGKSLYESGDIQGAIRETESILRQAPDNPDALYNLGAIYGNLGNASKAREYWERLIGTAPASESGKRASQLITQLRETSR